MIFGLKAYLILAAFLFSSGVYCVSTRRNAISILMGLELILNSANINYVAFSRFLPVPSEAAYAGQIFAIFVIMLAAAEAVIALAIIVSIFRTFKSIKVDEADTLKA